MLDGHAKYKKAEIRCLLVVYMKRIAFANVWKKCTYMYLPSSGLYRFTGWMSIHKKVQQTQAAFSSAEHLGTISRTWWGAMGWVAAGLKASEVNFKKQLWISGTSLWLMTLLREGGLNVGSWTSPRRHKLFHSVCYVVCWLYSALTINVFLLRWSSLIYISW